MPKVPHHGPTRAAASGQAPSTLQALGQQYRDGDREADVEIDPRNDQEDEPDQSEKMPKRGHPEDRMSLRTA